MTTTIRLIKICGRPLLAWGLQNRKNRCLIWATTNILLLSKIPWNENLTNSNNSNLNSLIHPTTTNTQQVNNPTKLASTRRCLGRGS